MHGSVRCALCLRCRWMGPQSNGECMACTLPQHEFRTKTTNTQCTLSVFLLSLRRSFAENKSIAHTIDRVYCSGTRVCICQLTMARQTIQCFASGHDNNMWRQAAMPKRASARHPTFHPNQAGWLLKFTINLRFFYFFFFSFLLFSLRFGFIVSILVSIRP